MHFCKICETTFLVGGPWKSNVVLEKSLKDGCNFLYEPWLGFLWFNSLLTPSGPFSFSLKINFAVYMLQV